MPPYLTTVSLTSNTSNDHRTLDMIPGRAYTIGRASKNKQDMRASPGNALFDCAVVSREHAELRSSPWQPPGKQVTLIDKKSLHGTTVNGTRLMPHQAFALKTGDVIKFGEKVARGDEAHDGVSVTFHQIQLDHHHDSSYRQPVSPSNIRGFHVPDDSDNSDYESEDDSFISHPQDSSSAKTTPEQAKMGSQKQPIDLEDVTACHRKIISLVDDDEPAWLNRSPVPIASQPAPRSTVPESIAGESILAPESLASAKPLSTADHFDIHDSDFDDDDDESVVEHNTGLSQILSVSAPSLVGSENEEEVEEEAEEEAELDYAVDMGNEYVGDVQEETYDNIYSLGCSPEPSDIASEQDDSDNEETTSFLSQRQPSEEPGEPSMPAQKPLWLDDLVNEAAAAQKPRYDPVRSSQPLDEQSMNSSPIGHATNYNPYMYCPPHVFYGAPSTNLATDMSGSTRWDLRPAYTSAQSTVDSTLKSPTDAVNVVDPRPGQASFGKMHYDVFSQAESMDFYSVPETTLIQPSSATVTVPLERQASNKGKLSIPNLLSPRTSQPEQESHGSEHLTGVAQVSTSTKRKASEVEDIQIDEPAAKKVATVDAATGTQRAIVVPVQMRTKKTTKRSLLRRVAGEAVKYTASATFGAAATVAFLNSTYAEQLIQYLS